MRRRSRSFAATLLLLVIAAVGALIQQRGEESLPEISAPEQSNRTGASRRSNDSADRQPSEKWREGNSNHAGAQVSGEEREAVEAVLETIARGGPFSYKRDGVVFANREQRLPRRARGYYREYSVPMPRSRHRGPRRIVKGREGELYYTRDHYKSFVTLDRGREGMP